MKVFVECIMTFAKTIVRVIYSCNGIRGFLLNPEALLCASPITIFQTIGKRIENKKKKNRLAIINTAQNSSDKKIISIILPVLNSEQTIEAAIKSIQAQSYPHWELLIIDDGSTDNTPNIINECAKQDSRIKRYQNTSNKGVAYARNVGLHYAKGDYLTFHDADDTSHAERLEYQVAALLSSHKAMITIFQNVRVNQQGEIFIINGKRKWNRVSGMMIKKQVIDKIGYFKAIKISEDSEYYERIIATFGKRSRKTLCSTLYYALFSPDSLLFSNAHVKINGRSIDYQIHAQALSTLEAYRQEHKQIKAGVLSPYQPFSIDKKITKYSNE